MFDQITLIVFPNLPVNIPTDQTPEAFIVWALVIVVLSLITMLSFIVKTYRRTEKLDQAVNHVGPNDDTLIQRVTYIKEVVDDLVKSQREFDKLGWSALPNDISSASLLTSTIRDLQNDILRIEGKIDSHVEWEMKEKYNHDKHQA